MFLLFCREQAEKTDPADQGIKVITQKPPNGHRDGLQVFGKINGEEGEKADLGHSAAARNGDEREEEIDDTLQEQDAEDLPVNIDAKSHHDRRGN